MGEVYLAVDTTLNRQVAIKFLSAPDDPRARQRLLREARAAAGLDHPGVCAVFQVGTDPTLGDFVVMQYVEGEPLSDRLRRGRLDSAEALRLCEQIAEALAAAHERGVVHRDLKPQNIIITPSGRPKLLDFGLAKRTLSGTAAAEAATTAALTHPHTILGTPGYQAPEQIRNTTVDRRADIFALGCVLYESLTGQRAFPGPTAPDMMGQILQTDPPPPSSLVPGLGDGIDALCARLLCKDVQKRCQSAEEAIGAIRALLPLGTPASDASWRTSRTLTNRWYPSAWRWVVGASSVVAATGVVLGLYNWRYRYRIPEPSAAAKTWFDRGVTAIREGAYAGARASFQEAIRLDPQFAQAYARLADAEHELDDQRGAQQALLHVNELVPDLSALRADDRFQLEAVTASVLGEHDRAVAAYRALANARPTDASAALDLGRAEEAAYRLTDARASYTKALQLDGQYAAAFARVGLLQGTPTATALNQLDEAVRLYRTAADIEGEAEALLRKGILLTNVGRYDDARQVLTHVNELTTDPRYVSQRLRASFAMASVTAFSGKYKDADDLGRKAVDQAIAKGWQGLAANGLVDLGNAQLQAGHYEGADAAYVHAISLASAEGAERTEMRARLTQASLRVATNQPQEAISLIQTPLKFFEEGHYESFEAQAKVILSRADGALERYEEAAKLASEVLTSSEAAGNDRLAAYAIANLATQLNALGRFPDDLADTLRLETIHRQQDDLSNLPVDLTNHAELLIELGRGKEAEPILDEVDQGIAQGKESYQARGQRVAFLRALGASVARQFAKVISVAPANLPSPSASDDTPLLIRVLAEHARTELGKSGASTMAIRGWPAAAHFPAVRREIAFWVADTLIRRGDRQGALTVVQAALGEPGGQGNVELRWRLEALAAEAGSSAKDNASMSAHARADLQRLGEQWGGALSTYLTRPDLQELHRTVQ